MPITEPMFLSTRGIVFRQTKYSDSSLVVSILTEDLGLRSYIIKGARGPKAKIKASLFQPLTLLNLVVNQQEKRNLNHLREVQAAYAYQTIPFNIRKSSVLLFLSELLTKSIQEEMVNPELFRYIFDHLVLLDQAPDIPGHYHLLFAIHLTRYLGFFPQGSYGDDSSVFDLEEGSFLHARPQHENFITGTGCLHFYHLLQTLPRDYASVSLPPSARYDLLLKILRYYHLHLPLQGEFKSPAILHEVLQK